MTDALLLVTTACPHCPAMMQQLSTLLKNGLLGRLEMVNIVTRPEVAARYNVRSVPWLKLGEYEFSGAMSLAEIEKWIGLAEGQSDRGKLFSEQLKTGALEDVLSLAQRQPGILSDLMAILSTDDVPLAVRIGISAVIESFEERRDVLAKLVPAMLELTHHEAPATRADACHFLGLAGGIEAQKGLRACLDDPQQMVRQIAEESLQAISGI